MLQACLIVIAFVVVVIVIYLFRYLRLYIYVYINMNISKYENKLYNYVLQEIEPLRNFDKQGPDKTVHMYITYYTEL